MNLNELQKKLFAAARLNPPEDTVPYAFEKRIMAHLSHPPVTDTWKLWNRALWQAAAPCVAVVLLLGAWTLVSPTFQSEETLAVELEEAMYAPFDALGDEW